MIGNDNINIKASCRTSILLVLLALNMTFSAPAYAALACNACHTMPPLDSATGDREPSSGAFKGNHQGHSGNSVDSCVPCHGAAVSSYKASHSAVPAGSDVNSVIVLTPALNNYSIGHTLAAYSRGTFFNQTTVPPSTLGNCSSVNCHFENITPAWGTTNFAAPADCDKCHGAPPSGTTTGAAGSHAKHVLNYPGVTNCQKCHPNNTNFQHATSAGNRPLGISFAAAPNNGSGTYSGMLNDYLPSQNNAFGDCSATYCHGTTMNPNGGTDITPTWDTASSGQCGTCHGATSANPPLRGSHRTHTGTAQTWHDSNLTPPFNNYVYERNIACSVCHKSGSNKHVDGNADWSFNSISSPLLSGARYRGLSSGSVSSVPSSSYGQCSNLYCHSIIQTSTGGALTGAANEYQTVTWGNLDEGTCGSCHAVDKAHAAWAHRGTAAEISSGSHTKHLKPLTVLFNSNGGPMNCAVCHNYAGADDINNCSTTPCHVGQAAHVDYKVDVKFPATLYGATAAYTGTPAPGDGYGNCTATYCHSDGKATPTTYAVPTWGNVASGACGTCHGATAASPPASTPHIKHLGSTNPYIIACAACHSSKVQATANATIQPSYANLTSHVNKLRDVKFDSGSPFGTYSSANQSCRNLYCHSIGNLNVTAGALPAAYNGKLYARQTWSGTLACNGCHGRSSSTGMPDYTSGGVATTTANSHPKHVSTGNIACVECHEKTTKSGTAIRSTVPGKHVNATTTDVFFNLSGRSASGTYNSTRKRCYNTYCHSDGSKGSGPFVPYSSVAWGASLTCASCHKADIASGNTFATNSHVGHINKFGGQYSTIMCVKCHAVTAKADMTIAPGAHHTNAQIEIAFDSSSSAANGTYIGTPATPTSPMTKVPGSAKGTCANIYCHSSGQGADGSWPPTYYTTPAWGTSDMQFCGKCHGFPFVHGGSFGTLTPLTTGSHVKHLKYQMNVTYRDYERCVACHAYKRTGFDPLSCNATLCHGAGYMKHSNHEINVLFPVFFGASAAFNGTTKPGHDGAGYTNSTCSLVYCHSNGLATAPTYVTPKWGDPATAACGTCHGANAATPPASSRHAKHVGSASQYQYACALCHAGIVKHNANSTTYAVISTATTIGSFDGSRLHVNKSRNVKFDALNSSGTYTIATQTCASTYCHSKGTSATPASAPPNIAATWVGALNATCSGCHGNDNSADYKMGTVGSASHLKHIQTYTGFSCDYCHASTVSNSRTISTQANHVNRMVDVDFNTWVNTNATYGGSTLNSKLPGSAMASCANTYCHSNGTSVATGTVPANTTVSWGTAGPLACNSCHGNATYSSDFRKAAPLYATGSPKGNAHASHIRTGSLSGVYMQCFNCHAGTTRDNSTIFDTANHVNKVYNAISVFGSYSSTFRDGDNTMNSTKVTLTYNYNASGSSCSNVSCHPIGLDITTAPPTPKTRSTSTVKWNSSGICIDCHNIDMQSTSTFHHAMRNYSAGYPLLSPYSSASTGVNVYARRCTMCHVDHNIFSNDLNSSNTLGRAGNLRTDISVAPTASSGYSNKDYIKSGSGGICISCHNTAKAKDTTRRKNDYPANVTPVVTQAQYSGSGHQYDVTAKFMSDGSVVYGNCSKCHNALLNETSVFMNATSTYQFGNHNSGVRRLQGTLDAAGGETAEEQICYRCHSLITDADPGGGPPKAVANKDFYSVAPMSLASQDIFDANLDFRAASATSTTNKLYFKPAAAESPAEAMPNQHNTGDTLAGGTWIGRAMSPWETTTAYETKSQETNTTGTNYWRMVTFTSPKVYSTTTLPAGNWMINVYCRESSTAQNAKIRYMVYKWNDPADTMGATIIGKGTHATELATTAAPGAVRQIAVSVPATTLNAGEKIVVDLELDTTSSYATTYTASFYFGSHAPSDLTLPGNVIWDYAAPAVAGYGHATQHYFGIHLPSTKNETLAYIAQNKHIECVDCHNPHATRNGLHGDYGIATGGSSTTLVNSAKQWVPNQWVGAFVSLIPTTPSTTAPISTITSNNATTLTTTPYSGTWVAPVAGSVYRIIKNTNKVSNSQRGVPGASVSYSGAWTNGTYSLVEEATYEYQICFKCHAVTNATTNSLRYWNVTSASLGAARWTNIGLEFNPNNVSYHPVVQPLPASGTPRQLEAGALTGGWKSGDVMSCSDCHGRDTSTSATAQGPHGSTVKWLLTGKYQNWPFTSAAANGTAAGGTFLAGTGTSTYPSSNFCFNCHTWAAGGNAHVKSINHVVACVVCHIRVPHGGKVPRLLTGTNAPPRYKPDGNGGGATYYLTSAKLPATGYMLKTDISCSKTCGQHPAFPVAGAYYW